MTNQNKKISYEKLPDAEREAAIGTALITALSVAIAAVAF
jgi:hypothetical protein